MARITALVLAAVVCTSGLSGCAASKRVYDKSYLRAAAVGGTDKKTLTLTFYDEDSAVIGIGDDIDSAKHDAELQIGKEIFTGHTEIVITDENDVAERLQYFLNDWKVSPTCVVAVGQDGSELLQNTDAEILLGSVKQAKEQKIAPDCDIITVLGKLLRSEPAQTAELSEYGFAGTRVIAADQF